MVHINNKGETLALGLQFAGATDERLATFLHEA